MERLKGSLAKWVRLVMAVVLGCAIFLASLFIILEIVMLGFKESYVGRVYDAAFVDNDSPYRAYQRWMGVYLDEDPAAYKTPEQILEMLELYKVGSPYRLRNEIDDEERAGRKEAIQTLIGYMNARDAVADAAIAAAKGRFAIYLLYKTPYIEAASFMRPPPPVYMNTGAACLAYEAYQDIEYFITVLPLENYEKEGEAEPLFWVRLRNEDDGPPYKIEREFIDAFAAYLKRYNRAMLARADFPNHDICATIPVDAVVGRSDMEQMAKERLDVRPAP